VVVECERGGGRATEARCDDGHAAAVDCYLTVLICSFFCG
jgi:hypothetical protein